MSILSYASSNFMKNHKFEVSNQRKLILVIGLTGTGNSSFINFMTGKNICQASDDGESCSKDYKMIILLDTHC